MDKRKNNNFLNQITTAKREEIERAKKAVREYLTGKARHGRPATRFENLLNVKAYGYCRNRASISSKGTYILNLIPHALQQLTKPEALPQYRADRIKILQRFSR